MFGCPPQQTYAHTRAYVETNSGGTHMPNHGELVPSSSTLSHLMRATDPLSSPSPRIQRALSKLKTNGQLAITEALVEGAVGAAQAQAAEYQAEARIDAAEQVTERAMLSLDRLHRVKKVMAADNPLEADEYDGLMRDFLLVARNTIRNLPREW